MNTPTPARRASLSELERHIEEGESRGWSPVFVVSLGLGPLWMEGAFYAAVEEGRSPLPGHRPECACPSPGAPGAHLSADDAGAYELVARLSAGRIRVRLGHDVRQAVDVTELVVSLDSADIVGILDPGLSVEVLPESWSAAGGAPDDDAGPPAL